MRRKIEADYHDLVKKRAIKWIDKELPKYTHTNTRWRCLKDPTHGWEACYNKIQQGTGCPHCMDMINGYHVSQPQRQIAALVGGILNHPCGRYRIDVALLDQKVALEYDSWYWHGGNDLGKEKKRDRFLTSQGWAVLHIQANTLVPIRPEILTAIDNLAQGNIGYLTLADWGKGPTCSARG